MFCVLLEVSNVRGQVRTPCVSGWPYGVGDTAIQLRPLAEGHPLTQVVLTTS